MEDRRKRGRPAIDPEAVKVSLTLTIRPEVRERVFDCARRAGMSVSAWIERAAQEAIDKDKPLPDSQTAK